MLPGRRPPPSPPAAASVSARRRRLCHRAGEELHRHRHGGSFGLAWRRTTTSTTPTPRSWSRTAGALGTIVYVYVLYHPTTSSSSTPATRRRHPRASPSADLGEQPLPVQPGPPFLPLLWMPPSCASSSPSAAVSTTSTGTSTAPLPQATPCTHAQHTLQNADALPRSTCTSASRLRSISSPSLLSLKV